MTSIDELKQTMPEFITAKELAELYDISIICANSWIRKGKFKSVT